MREMHGCGHMYRYCFNGTDFQFWEYDKLLPTAEILESPALVCRMALYRLYWPKGLTEEWKEEYWKYIKKYLDEAAKGLTERGEREDPFLAGRGKRDGQPDVRADDPGYSRTGGCPGFCHSYGCKA